MNKKILSLGKFDFYLVDFIVYLFSLLFIVAGALVSLNRYFQYDVYYYDFGIFDQAIWEVSRFQPPIINHLVVGGRWIFADHFSPSIFLLSPLYWFTDKSEILLIFQAIAVGLSGLVLYKIGLEIIKSRFLSFSILACYFLFTGLQNAVITDFHEVTVMTLPLMLTFWALIKKKTLLYFILLIITLGFKESAFLVGVGIGIASFFILRAEVSIKEKIKSFGLRSFVEEEFYKIPLITVFISLLWGVFSIKFMIPHFSGGIYQYSSVLPSGMMDKVTVFFDQPIKRRTLFYSFFSFGFLPILSPAFWFLIFQDFLTRFGAQNWPTRWGLGLHYSALLSVILAVSSLYTLSFLGKFKKIKRFLPVLGMLLILNALFLYRFVLKGPFALSYNYAFYQHSKDFVFLDDLVKKIPKNATVMTQNNLAVRFTHQKLLLLDENYSQMNPDYVLIDVRKGQSPNDFFGNGDIPTILKNINNDKNYSLIYKSKEQFIFKRKK